MLSEVPSGLHISDNNVIRKHIRHALYFLLVVIEVYFLLTSCNTFVSLYLFGVKVNLSLIFSSIRW